MELRDKAYEQWLNEQQDKYNQYGLLSDAEAQDYNRYRDTVGDWQNERGYATDWYNTMSQQDYSRYADSRDFDENVRQFNESLDWDKMSAQQKLAAEYVSQILANGQMPSAELLAAAGLSQADAAKMMAQIQPTVVGVGSGGKDNGNGGQKLAAEGMGGYFYEVDSNGKPKLDSKGNYIQVDPAKSNDYLYLNDKWDYAAPTIVKPMAEAATKSVNEYLKKLNPFGKKN